MGKRLQQIPQVDVNVSLKLNMIEVQALEALAGYGVDSFLEVFYKHIGKHYLEPHERGLRSLFETIQSELPPIICRYESACQAFALHDPVIRSRKEHNEMIARLTKPATTKEPA